MISRVKNLKFAKSLTFKYDAHLGTFMGTVKGSFIFKSFGRSCP